MASRNDDGVIDFTAFRDRRNSNAEAAVLTLFSQVTGKPMHLVNRSPEELAARRDRALRRRAERVERIRMVIESGTLVYQDDDPDGIIGA